MLNIFKCHWMWYVKSIFNIINFPSCLSLYKLCIHVSLDEAKKEINKREKIFIKMNDIFATSNPHIHMLQRRDWDGNISWMLIVIDTLKTKQLNTCRQWTWGDQKKEKRIELHKQCDYLWILYCTKRNREKNWIFNKNLLFICCHMKGT